MNAKLAKTIVSTASSILFSVALGSIYKLGRRVNERIDEYYDETKPESDQDN